MGGVDEDRAHKWAALNRQCSMNGAKAAQPPFMGGSSTQPVPFMGGCRLCRSYDWRVVATMGRPSLDQREPSRGHASLQRLRFVVEDSFDLSARHTRKPFQKLVNRRSIAQVFKQRGHRNAGVAKHPRPTAYRAHAQPPPASPTVSSAYCFHTSSRARQGHCNTADLVTNEAAATSRSPPPNMLFPRPAPRQVADFRRAQGGSASGHCTRTTGCRHS